MLSAGRRRLLVWLLIVALPLQSVALGALAAQGPLHVHKKQSAAALIDFRRQAEGAVALPLHVHGWLGIAHASALRHHHAAGDASVVASADDPGAGDGHAAPLMGDFLPLLPALPAWAPPRIAQRRPAEPACAFATRFAPRLERPPRA